MFIVLVSNVSVIIDGNDENKYLQEERWFVEGMYKRRNDSDSNPYREVCKMRIYLELVEASETPNVGL